MASRKTPRRLSPRARRLLPRAVAPVTAAALSAGLLGGGGALAGAAPKAPPGYAALGSAEPSGLALVDPGAPGSAAPAGPEWPATAPAGAGGYWPVTASIRPLKLSVPGVRGWIARSLAGGVCVMLYYGVSYEGRSAIGLSCSSPEEAGTGTSLVVSGVPGMPGRVIEAGVVPDGVSAVRTVLADGSTSTQQVSDNGWARSGSEPPAPGAEPTPITGG